MLTCFLLLDFAKTSSHTDQIKWDPGVGLPLTAYFLGIAVLKEKIKTTDARSMNT